MPQKRHRSRDDFDPEDFRTACEMYQNGDGVTKIGAFLQRSDTVIEAWVGGLTRGSRNWTRGTPAEREMVRRLSGRLTVTELAGLMDRSPSTIDVWIKNPERGDGHQTVKARTDELALKAYTFRTEREMPVEKIADLMGVSASTVTRWITRAKKLI
ncbi:helix-turn-helix domain-containing protein [Streptomyces sp. NPDC008079]|uniref:helix-turn-helix domain-containing protein n=1 Tax=Streptomyces sp. NPDC008079 TaxID=3364806 RepID=UPI0036E3653E